MNNIVICKNVNLIYQNSAEIENLDLTGKSLKNATGKAVTVNKWTKKKNVDFKSSEN